MAMAHVARLDSALLEMHLRQVTRGASGHANTTFPRYSVLLNMNSDYLAFFLVPKHTTQIEKVPLLLAYIRHAGTLGRTTVYELLKSARGLGPKPVFAQPGTSRKIEPRFGRGIGRCNKARQCMKNGLKQSLEVLFQPNWSDATVLLHHRRFKFLLSVKEDVSSLLG